MPLPAEAKADFRNFLWMVWRHLSLPVPTPNQYAIAHFMQHGPRRRMVKAFRGVGKSYIASAFALWWLDRDPTDNVIIYSAAKQRADAFTTFMLKLVDEMPELAHLRPKEGQRRSMIAFDIGLAPPMHTPSVLSTGIFGSATGHRGGLIIPDDVEVPNNSETVTMREKLEGRTREWDAILKPNGQIVALGTDQTEDTIYKELPARGFTVFVVPARYPDPALQDALGDSLAPHIRESLEKDPTLVGRTTEPARFSDLELAQRELSYGKAEFARQFMLDPRLGDQELYPLKLSDCMVYSLDSELAPERLVWSSAVEYRLPDLPCVGLKGDRWYRGIPPWGTGERERYLPYGGTMLAIDPAGRGADETAYAVVSTLNGMLFVRDAGGLKGYEGDTLQALANIAKKYKVNAIRIEPNFGDGMFLSLLKPVMAATWPCDMQDSERSQAQKEKRIIATLGPVLESHRLVIDEKVIKQDYESTADRPPEQAVKYRLFYQLTRITKQKGCLKHDDRLDALALAVSYWQKAVERDVEMAAAARREKDKEKQLKDFVKSVKAGPFAKHKQRPAPRLWATRP